MSPESNIKEIKELPDKLYVVVADDDLWQSHKNTNALRALNPKWDVVRVESARKLFMQGMLGDRDLQQADLVVLDNKFYIETKEDRKWLYDRSPHAKQVVERLVRKGVDKYHAENFLYPGGVNFAIALRTLGYRQSIIIISNGPPDHEVLKMYERDVKVPVLVNGTSSKGTKKGDFFCKYRYLRGGTAGIEKATINGTLENSLAWLLPRVISDR
jgi:hypothetical protein